MRPAVTRTPKTDSGERTNRLEELKKNLISRREAIVREAKEEIAKYISGENRQLVDTALDDGDWAVVDISEDINLRRLGAHRKALHDIDESLRKIKEGTYGTCEECGEEISKKRLQVLPTANLCITCQENKEQFEALEKTETP
jgi:DnaK suppressor protein